MTITLSLWMLPTALTVLAFVVWWFTTPEESGMFAGLGAMLGLVPTLFFICFVWMVYGLAT